MKKDELVKIIQTKYGGEINNLKNTKNATRKYINVNKNLLNNTYTNNDYDNEAMSNNKLYDNIYKKK